MEGKCIIISAPSGAGKTTIVQALLKDMIQLAFSISACSREPRGKEENGIDYYFLSKEVPKELVRDLLADPPNLSFLLFSPLLFLFPCFLHALAILQGNTLSTIQDVIWRKLCLQF